MKGGHIVFSGDSKCDNWPYWEYASLLLLYRCGRGPAAIAYSDWHRPPWHDHGVISRFYASAVPADLKPMLAGTDMIEAGTGASI